MVFLSGTADLVYTLSCVSQLEIMKQHIDVWFSPYSVCFWYLTSSSLWHYSRLSKIYRVNQGLCYFVRKSSVAIALYGFYDLLIFYNLIILNTCFPDVLWIIFNSWKMVEPWFTACRSTSSISWSSPGCSLMKSHFRTCTAVCVSFWKLFLNKLCDVVLPFLVAGSQERWMPY